MGVDDRAQDLDGPQLNVFARRLEELCGATSSAEIADALLAATGFSISGQYIWLLRTGRKKNPSDGVVQALATYFGRSPAFFFTEDPAAEAVEPRLLSDEEETEIKHLAFRARGLSPASRKAVAAMIEHALELEASSAGLTGKGSRRSREDPDG